MQKYINLEHTADLKIKAFGKTKEELFANAAYGMFQQIESRKGEKGLPAQAGEVTRKIKIESVDLEALLVDFLSELLSLSDQYNEIYRDCKLKITDDKLLEGEISGNKVESFETEIKAVTYHELKIEKENSHLTAEIVFDI